MSVDSDTVVTSSPGSRSIPSLDGLRALSIALVIVAHIVTKLRVSGWRERALDNGTLGVNVFFVISGFLITTLLMREMDRERGINLQRFYFRRSLRIFPAYFAYLAVIALIASAGLAQSHFRWLPALTYTSNIFFTKQSWLLGHSWSLSVEEQFYLCWPACLILLGRRGALRTAVAVLALSPLLRLGVFVVTRSGPLAFFPQYDCIAAGCVLGLAWPRVRSDERFRAALRSPGFILVPLSTWIVAAVFKDQMRWFFIADILLARTYVAVGVALTVAWCMLNADSTVGRLLNLRLVRLVGVLSYSLYLWQQPFTWSQSSLPLWLAPMAALLAAVASYAFIERPGLKLREKLDVRARSRRSLNVPDADVVSTSAA